jgi:hypothetical protein
MSGGSLEVVVDPEKAVPRHAVPNMENLMGYCGEELRGGNDFPEGEPLLVGLRAMSIDEFLHASGFTVELTQEVPAGELRHLSRSLGKLTETGKPVCLTREESGELSIVGSNRCLATAGCRHAIEIVVRCSSGFKWIMESEKRRSADTLPASSGCASLKTSLDFRISAT